MIAKSSPAYRLVGAVLLALIVGLILRWSDCASKAYGNDEATTSLRVAGATIGQYQRLFDGKPRSVAELRQYQERLPDSSFASVSRSLALEDPQHPPLFYWVDRAWITLGGGVAMHRYPALVFGVLAIPATAWLAFEISGSLLAAAVTSTLVAVSPFFIVYSQQAREYSLWTLLTACATAVLLRMTRSVPATEVSPSRWRTVAGYGLVMVMGCATDILFFGVLAAHALAVLCATRGKQRVMLLAAQIAAGAVFAAWWMPHVIGNRGAVTNNVFLATHLPLKVFVAKWLLNISLLGVDMQLLPSGYHASWLINIGALAAVGILALLTVAVVRIRQLAPLPRWVISALFVIPAVMLVLPDLVQHTSRSTAARYLVPTWLVAEVLIGCALAQLLEQRRRYGIALLGIVVAAGIGSAWARAAVPAWWYDWSAYGVVAQSGAIALLPSERRTIAFIDDPAVWDFSVMELVNRVDAATTFVLYPNAVAYAYDTRRPLLVLDPSGAVRQQLQLAHIRLTAIPLGASRLAPALLHKDTSPASDDEMTIGLWQACRVGSYPALRQASLLLGQDCRALSVNPSS